MREIKFRAWDKAQNKYIDPGNVRLHGNGSISIMGHRFAENIDIELFTGLHDADGREIFEGDILESPHYVKATTGKQQYLRHVVEWNDRLSCWWMRNTQAEDDNDGCCQIWVGMKHGPHRVIGNIHESPELLTGDRE